MNDLATANDLADAIAELADTYPTDADHEVEAVLVVQDVDGRQLGHAITLQPGQVVWLTDLVRRELTLCRLAHPDQTDDPWDCIPG